MKFRAWFRKHILRQTKDGRHRVVGNGVSTMQFISGPKPVGRAEVTSSYGDRAEKKLVDSRMDYVPPSLAVAGAEADAAEEELTKASQPITEEDLELSLSEEKGLTD